MDKIVIICKENLDMVKGWTSKLCDNLEALSDVMEGGSSFICPSLLTDNQVKTANDIIAASECIIADLSTDDVLKQYPEDEAKKFVEGLLEIKLALSKYKRMLEQHISNMWMYKILGDNY